jgi:hypothetical protein
LVYLEYVDEPQNRDVEAWQRETEALRQELEWTCRQHARWIVERKDLVAAMRELRARVPDSEAHFQRNGNRELVEDAERLSAALREAQAWNVKLTEAREWHAAQAKNWQEEAERVSAALREAQAWNAELTEAREWHATQAKNWQELHGSQAKNWQEEAERLSAALRETQAEVLSARLREEQRWNAKLGRAYRGVRNRIRIRRRSPH